MDENKKDDVVCGHDRISDTVSYTHLDVYKRQMLRDGSMSAGEIGVHFDMTGATISYHLKILKKAELIFEKKEKNYIYYTLNTSVVEEVMLWLSELKGGNHDVKEE